MEKIVKDVFAGKVSLGNFQYENMDLWNVLEKHYSAILGPVDIVNIGFVIRAEQILPEALWKALPKNL